MTRIVKRRTNLGHYVKNTGGYLVKATKDDTIRPSILYGANILLRPLTSVANFWGAVICGSERLIEIFFYPDLAHNPYIRLAKVTGAVLYGYFALSNFASGNFGSVLLDGAMTAELGIEAAKGYRSGSSIGNDVRNARSGLESILKRNKD